jgi:sugar phosphate isomerase/epimerase
MLERRDFIRLLGAAGLAALGGGSSHAQSSQWGLQLYSVRRVLGVRPWETLEEIAHIGFRELEVLSGHMTALAPLFKEIGLIPVSAHFPAPLVTGNWEIREPIVSERRPGYGWNEAIEESLALGLKYMVIPYLMPKERGEPDPLEMNGLEPEERERLLDQVKKRKNLDFYRRFADQMNRAGEQCRRAGLSLCYHNHAFEFEPMEEGTTPLDVLMERLEPGLVGLELDVFWSHVAGVDPVTLLERYPQRIPLLHLKDVAEGVKQTYDEREIRPSAFKEVGGGVLDFNSILAAAVQAGVQHYFVEQDHPDDDPMTSLRKSYGYLTTL